MGKYCIVGIGESELGQVPQSTSLGLTVQTALRAFADTGLAPHQVDGCLSKPPYQEPTFLFTDQLAASLGLRLRYGHDLPAGGCTPILALAIELAGEVCFTPVTAEVSLPVSVPSI